MGSHPVTDALLAIAAFMALAAFGGWVGALVAIRSAQVTVVCVHDDPMCRHDRRKEERVN
jgi:hypothetical protein